jgi:hypothetical protein
MDLTIFAEHFVSGDPSVQLRDNGQYWVSSDDLEGTGHQVDEVAAIGLIDRMNGVATILNGDFQGISLAGGYEDGDGRPVGVPRTSRGGGITINARSRLKIGGAYPGAPFLDTGNDDVDDVLRLLGRRRLDWYDIYKLKEIIEGAAGGPKAIAAQGWATKADLDRVGASSNHPGISGDGARHARYKGTPNAANTISLEDATNLIVELARRWVRSVVG